MASHKKASMVTLYLSTGMLLSGTFASIGVKILYDYKTEGHCGRGTFQKPYFTVVVMFIAEALCLVLHHASRLYQRHHSTKTVDGTDGTGTLQSASSPLLPVVSSSPDPPLLGDRAAESAAYRKMSDHTSDAVQPLSSELDGDVMLVSPESAPAQSAVPKHYFLILCLFDLFATSAVLAGLVWLDASSVNMLSNSGILFTAAFSVLLLKRKLSRLELHAVLLDVIGLVLVGGADILQQHYDPNKTSAGSNPDGTGPQDPSDGSDSRTPVLVAVGVLLVLGGAMLNSLQAVCEEKLLKGAEVAPLELVGWEGVFGVVLSAFVLLPVVNAIPDHSSNSNCGKVESFADTMHMLRDPTVLGITFGNLIALCLFNYYVMAIQQVLSAVYRTLLSALRTVMVWVIGILLYYVFTPHQYGERWDLFGLLKLAGFAFLIAATLVYAYDKSRPAPETTPADSGSGDAVHSDWTDGTTAAVEGTRSQTP